MTSDPFERAAQREEMEGFRRDLMRAGKWAGSGGMIIALVTFGLPYVIWGLIRAATYHWGAPTLAQSVLHYFFGRPYVFGVYTAWMLFLLWAWAIVVVSFRLGEDWF